MFEFARAVGLRMRSHDLCDEGRSGARHSEDKYRAIRAVRIRCASVDDIRGERRADRFKRCERGDFVVREVSTHESVSGVEVVVSTSQFALSLSMAGKGELRLSTIFIRDVCCPLDFVQALEIAAREQ